MRRRKRSSSLLFVFIALIAVCFVILGLSQNYIRSIPIQAEILFGPPTSSLTPWQILRLSYRLTEGQKLLLEPLNPQGEETIFAIEAGQPTALILYNLDEQGLLADQELMRDYLVYTGMDTKLQPGVYQLSARMSAVEIAETLLDPASQFATLTILAGWRIEELAASLPTTGVEITPEEFLLAARNRYPGFAITAGAAGGATLEGLFIPGSYQVERAIAPEELVQFLLSEADRWIQETVIEGLENNGLSLYEGMILASIIEKEAVVADEMPMIASVFYNRLAISMKLETDPTVQYALGYNSAQGTWWTNPLTYNDLEVDSPHNTYRYPGLPPTPIAFPSLNALQAAAFPAQTPYYFFRAACDSSGRHNFSETFDQHLNFACE